MEEAGFYGRLGEALVEQGSQRHRLLSELHGDVLREHLAALEAIDEARSARTCADGRTLGQIVGHMGEWDRYAIQGAGELISGVRRPRIMRLAGYVDLDGSVHDFDGVAAFNAYQAAKHAGWPWRRIQQMARNAAQDLRRLLEDERLLSAARLDDSEPCDYELPRGNRLKVSIGWYLWIGSLEHCGVEHASDFAVV